MIPSPLWLYAPPFRCMHLPVTLEKLAHLIIPIVCCLLEWGDDLLALVSSGYTTIGECQQQELQHHFNHLRDALAAFRGRLVERGVSRYDDDKGD